MAIDYKDYLANFEQGYDIGSRSERWLITHAIPRDVWDTDNWVSMPAMGAAAPATYPSGLGLGGTLLHRRCDFKSEPGWVLAYLTYGFDPNAAVDNSAYITMRTILVEKTMEWSRDTPPKPMTGKVYDANKPSKRVYGVKNGPLRDEVPYQVIRIYALLDLAGRTTYALPLVHKAKYVNDDTWAFGGMTFAANTLIFRGVALDYSRRQGISATRRIYNTVFEFIESEIPWDLTVDRYEWKEIVRLVDTVDDDGVVAGPPSKVRGLQAVSATATVCIIRGEFAFDDILGSAGAPALIS